MKTILFAMILVLSTTLHAQESKDSSPKCGDGIAKCPSIKPEKPEGHESLCKNKCSDINDVSQQKICLKKCSDKPQKKPNSHTLICKKKCADINDVEKQKICLKKCKVVNHKKKKKIPSELASCEKTNSQTITCADGVYVKSSAVNNSEIIKEVIETHHDHANDDSSASEQ